MVEFINKEEGLLRLGGNFQIYKTLLEKFTHNDYYSRLCHHLTNNNFVEAKAIAHTIKGTAGNLSLTALFQIATALDSALKKEEDIQPIFEEFKSIYEATISEIKKTLYDDEEGSVDGQNLKYR